MAGSAISLSKFSVVLLVVNGILLSGCGALDSTDGSGKIVTESRTVSDFDSVQASGSFTLNIQQGNAESLSITADDNLLPSLETEVMGTRLVIGPRKSVSLNPTQRITYTLLVKDLKSIGASGDAIIEAKDIDTESLTVAVSGDGEVQLSGKVTSQKIAIAGSGKYDASGLDSVDTSISVTGEGNVVVAVRNRLDVNIIGSAVVEYIGDPEVTQNVAGDGEVRQRP